MGEWAIDGAQAELVGAAGELVAVCRVLDSGAIVVGVADGCPQVAVPPRVYLRLAVRALGPRLIQAALAASRIEDDGA